MTSTSDDTPLWPAADWNGRLAVVGADASSGRDPDEECRALLARGYAAIRTAADAEATCTRLDRATTALAASRGRRPTHVIAFAHGRAAALVLDLLAERPQALSGAVCASVEPPASRRNAPAGLDLGAFAAAGGRLVLVHGEADERVSPRTAVALFEAIERRSGGAVRTAGSARLFLVPDGDHAPRGRWNVDLEQAIARWLDWTPRRPPDVLRFERTASTASGGALFAPPPSDAVLASRPVYPYPLRSVFKGRGDPTHWKNWYAPAVYRRTPAPPGDDELAKPLPQDPGRRGGIAARPGVGPVLVVGATGRLGLELIASLRARGIAVRAAVRDATRAATLLPADVGIAIADVRDPAALTRAMAGMRNVIFAASATAGGDGANTPAAVEYGGVLACIAAARATDVRHFVLVSSAACTQPEHVHNLWGEILTWKARGEAALRASGVPYTILRPLGLRPAPGHDPYEPRTRGIRFAQGDRIAFGEEIHRADAATLCVTLLEHPAALGTTFEAYNDDSLPPDSWPAALDALRPD